MTSDRVSATVLGIFVCAGLVGAAAMLRRPLSEIRSGVRTVTVKGAAERDVRANLAVWQIQLRVAGSDLAAAGLSLDATRAKVLRFLSENGLEKDEISRKGLRVADRQASDYGGGNVRGLLRYMVAQTVVVRSRDVDKVQRVSQMTDELVRAGVVMGSTTEWQSSGPRFIFTELNAIKPAMLAEATKTARASAVQFASDSGSKVGGIASASQGFFAISDRDQTAPGLGEGNEVAGESEPDKRVRVVVTVSYVLEE